MRRYDTKHVSDLSGRFGIAETLNFLERNYSGMRVEAIVDAKSGLRGWYIVYSFLENKIDGNK